MKLIIDIPEDIREAIGQMGLLRIPDEMIRVVNKTIQHGIPLEQIKAEIERLHYHPKLDFIKNDEVVDMALDIIDRKSQEEG